MTVDERIEMVQTGIASHGEGFLAWLIRGALNYSDPELIDNFRGVYCGWYADRRTFMSHELNALDWLAEKDDFLDTLGLPPGALELNEASFWEHCKEIYVVEERLGGVHVFSR